MPPRLGQTGPIPPLATLTYPFVFNHLKHNVWLVHCNSTSGIQINLSPMPVKKGWDFNGDHTT